MPRAKKTVLAKEVEVKVEPIVEEIEERVEEVDPIVDDEPITTDDEPIEDIYSEEEYNGSVIIIETCYVGARVVVAKNGLYCTEFQDDVDTGVAKAKEYIDGRTV